jgi:hypothetical protein
MVSNSLPRFLLLGAMFLMGCDRGENLPKPQKDKNDQNAGDRDKADFTMTAEEFVNAKVAGPPFGAKFGGKRLAITGVVDRTYHDYVALRGFENRIVTCTFLPAFADKGHRLSIGQKVIVTGKADFLVPSCLTECSIVELEPSKLANLTAMEIANLIDEGGGIEKTEAKLAEKTGNHGFIISGMLHGITEETTKDKFTLQLEGSLKTRVRLWVKLRPGSPLPMKGQVVEASSTAKFVYGFYIDDYSVPANLLLAK